MVSGLLTIVAIALAAIGFFMLSNATLGVGLIALALVAGVLARLAQAEEHKRQLKAAIEAIRKEVEASRASQAP